MTRTTALELRSSTHRALACLAVIAATTLSASAYNQEIVLRSGNGDIGSSDAAVHVLPYLALGDVTPTLTNFTKAQAAQFAEVVSPFATYIPNLPADPLAKWVSTTQDLTPTSALYAVPFSVTVSTIASATLDLFFSVDNTVNGVYLNGHLISGDSHDGDYHGQFRFFRDDIAPLLLPDATNWLYLNVSDDGGLGALIFGATFSIDGGNTPLVISPDRGGNAGSVTATIVGPTFSTGTTALLRRAGEPDILGDNQRIDGVGRALTVRFDLRNRATGSWDVIVSRFNGASVDLPSGFTIEAGGASAVWVDIIGANVIRPGHPQAYRVAYGNTGNVDAIGVPLWVEGIPPTSTLTVDSDLLPPIEVTDQSVDWRSAPTSLDLGDQRVIAALVALIPPQSVGTLDFTLEVADLNEFALRAEVNPPLFASPPSEHTIECVGLLIEAMLHRSITNSCTLARMLSFYELITHLAPNKLVNLAWTVLDVGFRCGIDVACAACTEVHLTQACVVCVSGKIIKTGLDLYHGWHSGFACFETGVDVGEALMRILPVNSFDPNLKEGPTGVGTERFVASDKPILYAIHFENAGTATAPAQEVVIADDLDESLIDIDSVRLGTIAFGRHRVELDLGATALPTDIDLRPDQNLIVHVVGGVEPATSVLSWRLTSLDPDTGVPPTDPLAGFLPPNVSPPEGEGYVTFTCRVREDATNGSVVRNIASIKFDTNSPIFTEKWSNVIDSAAPKSTVIALPRIEGERSFGVKWVGVDAESGIRDFSVYVSDNGGAFAPWISFTTSTSAVFTGEPGHRYCFFSTARDSAGNAEVSHTRPDTCTRILERATTRDR